MTEIPTHTMFMALRRAENQERAAKKEAAEMRYLLGERTGHKPRYHNGDLIACECGYVSGPGGYPSDHAIRVSNHIFTEWENAANG